MSADMQSEVVDEVESYSDDDSSSIEPPLISEGEESVTDDQDCGPAVTEPSQEESQPPARSHVAARLKESKKHYVKNMYRSSDLIPLMADFETFRKHLRSLLSTAKVYSDANEKLGECRTEVRI
jgi:hypothetical protein